MAAALSIRSRRFLGQVWELTTPYWRSEEKASAWLLLGTIVAMTLGIVYMLVLFNEWNRQFFDALEKKNAEDFFALMLYFCSPTTPTSVSPRTCGCSRPAPSR